MKRMVLSLYLCTLVLTQFSLINAMCWKRKVVAEEKKECAADFALTDIVVPGVVNFLDEHIYIKFPDYKNGLIIEKNGDREEGTVSGSLFVYNNITKETEKIGETKFVLRKNANGIDVYWSLFATNGDTTDGAISVEAKVPAYHPGKLITYTSLFLVGAYLDRRFLEKEPDPICALCLEPFLQETTTLERCYTNCYHAFHVKCFGNLVKHAQKQRIQLVCPCCRGEIPTVNSYVRVPQTPFPVK
ncbi:MAG: hypothetical protein WCW33_05905 [Candidatus Babeliales bacterium]